MCECGIHEYSSAQNDAPGALISSGGTFCGIRFSALRSQLAPGGRRDFLLLPTDFPVGRWQLGVQGDQRPTSIHVEAQEC